MSPSEVELKADVVIEAYKRKVAELQDQVIMLQAYLAQVSATNDSEE